MNRADLKEHERLERSPAAAASARVGVVFGLAAYSWWGLVPLYFHLLRHVPPIQVLAHRIIWSVALLVALVTLTGRWGALFPVLRRRRTMVMLLMSTIVVATNWYTFIYAIERGRVLEASLGYFINPLWIVVLGIVFLRERLRGWQAAALGLATVGVALLTWWRGQVPWLALILAVSFGFYGLLRKITPVDAIHGLLIETALLFVPAMLAVAVAIRGNDGGPAFDVQTKLLLALAGVVTAVPLLFFTAAAQRLRLATIGFLQYVGPTLQFLLAVLVFGEPFGATELVSFGLIWTALLLFSWDSYRAYRAATLSEAPESALVPVEP
jgi:chloramphenicol-sensitive protein RarD